MSIQEMLILDAPTDPAHDEFNARYGTFAEEATKPGANVGLLAAATRDLQAIYDKACADHRRVFIGDCPHKFRKVVILMNLYLIQFTCQCLLFKGGAAIAELAETWGEIEGMFKDIDVIADRVTATWDVPTSIKILHMNRATAEICLRQLK